MSTLDFADLQGDPKKEPFHPSADPDIFFGTEALTAAYARLIAALESDVPPVAVLTGPAGVGKTTMLRRLARALGGAGWRTVVEGLPLGLDDLRERLPGAEPGRRVLVGLDEAQALPHDLLAALDSLLALRPDLAILLVGHSSLEAKLDGLAIDGEARREVVRCRLAALDAAGVGEYIDHRWRAVRLAAHPFAPDAVERIAALSGGVPQLINLVCSLALRRANRRGLDRVTADLVDEVEAELPRPEPRRRIGLAPRPTRGASVRSTRAAVAAAVVIPPLLVGGVLLLRPAARGPQRLDSPPAATASLPSSESVRGAALPGRPDPPAAVTAPHPSSEPLRVAALVPEPASIDFTTDAAFERPGASPPAVTPAPSPPTLVPQALEPPQRGAGETKGGREALSPTVPATTPTPASPKAPAAPTLPQPKASAATPSPASPKLAGVPTPSTPKASTTPSPSSAKATTAISPSLSAKATTPTVPSPSAKAGAVTSSPPSAKAGAVTSLSPSAKATATTSPSPSTKATAATSPSTSGKATATTPTLPPTKMVAATDTSPSLPPRAVLVSPVAGVAAREPGKDEALLRRAEYGELSAVQALLVEGASPEARDPNGFTPLMLAVIHGDPAIVQALLAAGARVNVQNRAGLTPAMLAAINNRAAVLRLLLDRGADVNARTRAGWTALTYAAWRGHAEVVRVLLARGADPNVTDREGWTILQYASWRATDPIASDDIPGAPADMVARASSPGPGHAEVVSLLKQARVRR